MPYNGSGIFLRVRRWVNDASANIKIRADYHDSEDDNFAQGLTMALTRDGQSTVLANLPMAGYRHTNVSDAQNRNEYITAGQVQNGSVNVSSISGSSNAYTMSPTIPITSYASGQTFWGVMNATNSGASTLNISGLGAKSIKSFGTTDVVSGELVSGKLYAFQYDGTNFVVSSGSQFIDAGLQIIGSSDQTKKASFEVDGLTTSTTRVLTVQDVNGTIYVTGGQDVSIADGGTGAGTAADAFTNLKQAATTSATGVVELATSAEMTAFAGGVVPTADIMPCAKISTTVISSGSATSGTISIPTGMSKYVINYDNFLPVTDGVIPYMQVSVDGGSTWITSYYSQVFVAGSTTGTSSSDSSSSVTLILPGNTTTNSSSFPCFGAIEINNAVPSGNKTILTRGYYRRPGENMNYYGIAVPITTSPINAVRFGFNTGNISSGTITVWAWK